MWKTQTSLSSSCLCIFFLLSCSENEIIIFETKGLQLKGDHHKLRTHKKWQTFPSSAQINVQATGGRQYINKKDRINLISYGCDKVKGISCYYSRGNEQSSIYSKLSVSTAS